MELLIYGIPHRVAHDLESLFYVLLFICTHLNGPHNTVRDPPLYGKGVKCEHAGGVGCKHPSPIKNWMCTTDPKSLGHMKFSHMIGHFEILILPNISPYFKPLTPHLSSLWKVLFPQRLTAPSVGQEATHSPATCLDVINIFKSVLEDKSLIEQAKNTSVLGKRSSPGDHVANTNDWDAVKVSRNLLTVEPGMKPTTTRRSALMTKGHRKSKGV